jgi:hypothetical protein
MNAAMPDYLLLTIYTESQAFHIFRRVALAREH